MLRTYEFAYPGAGLLVFKGSSEGSLKAIFHSKQNNEFFTVHSLKGRLHTKKVNKINNLQVKKFWGWAVLAGSCLTWLTNGTIRKQEQEGTF